MVGETFACHVGTPARQWDVTGAWSSVSLRPLTTTKIRKNSGIYNEDILHPQTRNIVCPSSALAYVVVPFLVFERQVTRVDQETHRNTSRWLKVFCFSHIKWTPRSRTDDVQKELDDLVTSLVKDRLRNCALSCVFFLTNWTCRYRNRSVVRVTWHCWGKVLELWIPRAQACRYSKETQRTVTVAIRIVSRCCILD